MAKASKDEHAHDQDQGMQDHEQKAAVSSAVCLPNGHKTRVSRTQTGDPTPRFS